MIACLLPPAYCALLTAYLAKYPIHIAAIITLLVLIVLAVVYPAKLFLFRIKFNYYKGSTLMQFTKTPNILARIFFYSKPTTVRYIGSNKQWFTFVNMAPGKKQKSRRMIDFLRREEAREAIIYRKRIAKKERV